MISELCIMNLSLTMYSIYIHICTLHSTCHYTLCWDVAEQIQHFNLVSGLSCVRQAMKRFNASLSLSPSILRSLKRVNNSNY